MIDELQKIREIYGWFTAETKPSAVDGFDNFELTSILRRKELAIPLDSFENFLRFIYKHSNNLDVEKIPYFLKLTNYLFSEKQIFIVKKPAQIGATTFFTALFAYYFLKYRLPVMYIAVDSGKADIIQNQLAIFLRSLGVQTLIKEPDFMLTDIGVIYFAYSTSAKSFRSKPAAFVFIDEAAGMPINIGGEGDVISLALARTTTFSNIRKIFVFSTPTHDASFLEKYYLKSDKIFTYKLKCNVCGHLFDPAVNDIISKSLIKCHNCHEKINRYEAIANGEWCEAGTENTSDIWAFKMNSICSPLADLKDIQYRYKLAENDMFALRSFLNLIMAEEYKMSEGGFPPIKIGTLQEEEGDIVLYSADPHQSDVHICEIVFKQSGFIYLKNAQIMSHGDYIEWLKTVPACVIDVGFFSNYDIASLPHELRNRMVAVKGSNRQEVVGEFVLYLRKKYIGLNLIYRQDVLMRLYRLCMEDKVLMNENISKEFLSQILTGFSKMGIQINKKNGKYFWAIPDEFHEYSHFIDCLIYAIAIFEHYKHSENFISRFTKRLKSVIIKNDGDKKNLLPIRIL